MVQGIRAGKPQKVYIRDDGSHATAGVRGNRAAEG